MKAFYFRSKIYFFKRSIGILTSSVFLTFYVFKLFHLFGPEGRPGSSDVYPLCKILGLSFDSIFSICSLVILPSPVHSVFSFFLCFWPSLLPIFQKFLKLFFLEIGFFVLPLFLAGFLAAGR